MVVPPLPYTLHTRYRSIAIAWTVILIPPIFLNLGLFYGLWYGTSLDRILVLTLPTAILGIFTILAIVERVYKLTKANTEYRPLGASRYALDIFQWGYFGALILISGLITTALARGDNDADNHEFQIRLVSLPASLLMVFLAILTLVSLLLNGLKVKLPFRFGSLDKGSIVRPAVYYIVEDVVAVDGEGGAEFREAWMKRYDSSEVFRMMVMEVSVVWTLAFFILAGVFAWLVLWLPKEAVYAVGWAGPFPVVGLLVVWTVFYIKARLREEKAAEGDGGEGEESVNGNGNGNGRVEPHVVDEETPLLMVDNEA